MNRIEFDPPKRVAAKDIKVGDVLDLEGDEYADTSEEFKGFEYEYQPVYLVEQETGDCTAIYGEGWGCGFPSNHLLTVVAHDQEIED